MQVLNKKSKTISKILIPIAIIATAVGLYSWYAHGASLWPFAPTPAEESDTINYQPPTEQDIKDGQDAKRKLAEQERDTDDTGDTQSNTDSSSVGPKRGVDIGVSYADIYDGNLEVRAFTNGVIQGNGTCTATATKGSETISKASDSFIDASSTICRPIYIPATDLSPGVWTVVVEFNSKDAVGKSKSLTVVVP